MPLSFLRGAKRLRWTTIDRLLALALEIYESRIDPVHGQRRDLAMDPDLADEWTGLAPMRDNAAAAMAVLAEQVKEDSHPETFRYVLGLREGWEERKAAKVAARQDALLRDETN